MQNVAQQSIDFISTHELEGSPDVYSVIYRYHAGDNAVVERVNELIAKDSCTEQALLAFHYELEGARSACLPDIVESLMNSVKDMGSVMGINEDVFSRAHSLLKDKKQSAEALTVLTEELVAASGNVAEAMSVMEVQLTESVAEISSLKNDLHESQKKVETDFLTGVGNRVYLERIFNSILTSRDSIKEGVSLAVVDVDNFKLLNDTHGHQIGDKVLCYISSHLQSYADREQFHVARFGGEEFALVFPDKALPDVFSLVDKVRAELSKKNITRKDTGQQLGKLTASFGIAHISQGDLNSGFEDELQLEKLMKRADGAMYQAKTTGKDKVIAATALCEMAISFT